MKLKVLVLLGCLSLLPSCMATAVMGTAVAGKAAFDQRPVKTQVKDTGISTRIQSELVKEQDMPSRWLNIDVIHGDVVLTGFLPKQEQIDRAVYITKKVEGVRSVRSEIQLGEPTAKNWFSDSWITTQIKTKLLKEGISNAVNISVETVDGVVYLQGIVSSEDQRFKAMGIARSVEGVSQVKNLLTVQKNKQ